MKSLGKSLTTKGIENIIVNSPGIRVEDKVEDKARKVTNYHYCKSIPKTRNNPTLVGLSRKVIQLLGYDYQAVQTDPNTPLYLSGTKIINGSIPICHNYCGFQFGVWAGQLGDGRAHTLGTIKNQGQIYEIQLKGSGINPFSRHADGNSVVSSATRQFLASQLMAGLNIPTTRAASIVFAQQDVLRDPFYDGRVKKQKAAIVLRVSPTFMRIGSFHVCDKNSNMYSSDLQQNRKILQPLIKYLNQNVYTDINEQQCDANEQIFREVVTRNSKLVAYWQVNGFVHGVLNTDNISMVGVTIDYGPFGFMDYYSKDYVSNATDTHQRYSYRQQPTAVKFNLIRLANSFDYLVPKSVLIKYVEQNFDKIYQQTYDKLIANKLGLANNQQNKKLISELFDIMHICGSNFTNVFRILNQIIPPSDSNVQQIVRRLLNQSLPTDYYLKSLRVYPQLTKLSKQKISQISHHDSGFNINFLSDQNSRMQMLQLLRSEDCQSRTKRQQQLWIKWVKLYMKCDIDCQIRQQNTVKYVLLNETAKNITQQLIKLNSEEQRKLLNKILNVFEHPYTYNQWFEQRYWKKRPVPVRLTCSS